MNKSNLCNLLATFWCKYLVHGVFGMSSTPAGNLGLLMLGGDADGNMALSSCRGK